MQQTNVFANETKNKIQAQGVSIKSLYIQMGSISISLSSITNGALLNTIKSHDSNLGNKNTKTCKVISSRSGMKYEWPNKK